MGSLTLAAERLGMSMSAASRMIAVLEHELKLKLFSRRNRKLDLTPEGREFLQRSQHILEGLERLPEIAAQVRSVDVEPLRLVSTVPLAMAVFAPVLALWQAQKPTASSVLNIETRFDLESKIAAREYNLGIMSLPVENAIVDLDVQPLARARYEFAMSPRHRLAGAETLSLSDLGDAAFVALRSFQRWRQRLDTLSAAEGVGLRIVSETSSTAAALELVRRDLGVMLVDRMHTGLDDDATLKLVPLRPEHWTEYCLVTGTGRRSPNAAAFAEHLRDWLQERCAASPAVAAAVKVTPVTAPRPSARARPAAAS